MQFQSDRVDMTVVEVTARRIEKFLRPPIGMDAELSEELQ